MVNQVLPGFSITIGYWGQMLSQQAIRDLLDLSGGHPERIALRYQAPMGKVANNWGIYDTAVTMCNNAGIPIYLECKQFDHGVTGPPSKDAMSIFAQQVASRYKGKLAAIGIGNEDYVNGDFGLLADTMIDVYPKIKAIDSNILILPGCTLHRNARNIMLYLTLLLQKAGKCMDGLTIHTYFGEPTGPNISNLPDDNSVGNVPSFPQYVAIAQAACKATGYPSMGIFDTEFGFACTPQNHGNVRVFSQADQAKHMLYCLNNALALGVRHMSWFTLGYAPTPDGMSLVQPGGPTPAYQAFKQFIAQHPTLGGSIPVPPTPSTKQQIADLLGKAKALSPATAQYLDPALQLLQTL